MSRSKAASVGGLFELADDMGKAIAPKDAA
jgi:hypothetical protein